MRIRPLAFFAVLPLCVVVGAACSSGKAASAQGSASTGAGGAAAASTTAHAAGSTTATTGAGAGDAGSDASDSGPDEMYPAAHAAPPQVISYGGPVLASPKIVPVFFSNDDPAFVAQLKDFVSKVGTTKYWEAATTEYGVGAATALTPVDLLELVRIDDSAIQTWLEGKLNSDDPAWPANDANTVYVLHYPAKVTITSGNQASCSAFGGYHSNVTLDAKHGNAEAAYAVVPRCASFGSLTGIHAITGAESHELIESVTDPYPLSNNPAYATVDDPHHYWVRALGGGEVGDMCAQFPQAFTEFPELAYTVQRTWSNKAALAGHDPCVPPFPNEGAYYNATPNLTDTFKATFMGQQITEKVVEIALGDSKTIDVDLFSDGPVTAPWTVEALDLASLLNPNAPAALDLSFNNDKGENGQKLQLTITVKVAGARGSETFLLVSKLNGAENWWIGLVGTPVADGGAPAGSSSSSSASSSSASSGGGGGAGGASGVDGG